MTSTRRQALAATAGLALLAAPASARAPEPREPEDVLADLIGVEQRLVIAYEALAAESFVDEEAAVLLRQLRDQEREHLSALEDDLRERGAEPPAALTRADVEGLEEVSTLEAALELAAALEENAVSAYARAALESRAATLLALAASIAGSEGQHLVLLRERLAREPVPDPVEGR